METNKEDMFKKYVVDSLRYPSSSEWAVYDNIKGILVEKIPSIKEEPKKTISKSKKGKLSMAEKKLKELEKKLREKQLKITTLNKEKKALSKKVKKLQEENKEIINKYASRFDLLDISTKPL